MSVESNPMSSLWPLVPTGATDWLLELCGDGVTGFMPPAMPDAAWVLNAMYEHEQGPVEVSYDEYHRARLADGSTRPHVVGGLDLDAVGIATGGEVWAVPGTMRDFGPHWSVGESPPGTDPGTTHCACECAGVCHEPQPPTPDLQLTIGSRLFGLLRGGRHVLPGPAGLAGEERADVAGLRAHAGRHRCGRPQKPLQFPCREADKDRSAARRV